MTIDGTLEIINNTSETFWTGGNIIAIIVAVISIIGSIIVVIISNSSTKKMNSANNKMQEKIHDNNTKLQEQWHKENLQIQEKLNQANIDANLIASARIEWIQNVRKTTSELISAYYNLLRIRNKADFTNLTNVVIEKSELLMLYFGPEDTNFQISSLEATTQLISTENNIGKNEGIVKKIADISHYFETDYQGEMEKIWSNDKKADELQEDLEIYRRNDTEKSITLVDEINNEIHQLAREIISLLNKQKQIKINISELRNIIRIYLKIEWNIAKSHK